MQTIATVLSPILANLITKLLKKPVPTYSPARTSVIRLILAVVSLALALATSYFFGNPFDNSLVTVVLDTLANFFVATGIFHIANNK